MQVNSWGYDAYPVSAATGEGLQALRGLLANKIAVVAGPSGAGKSSIINALWTQRDLQHRTGPIPSLPGSSDGEPSAAALSSAPDQPADGEQSASSNGMQTGSSTAACEQSSPPAGVPQQPGLSESPAAASGSMSLQEAVPEAMATGPGRSKAQPSDMPHQQPGLESGAASMAQSPDMLTVGDVSLGSNA